MLDFTTWRDIKHQYETPQYTWEVFGRYVGHTAFRGGMSAKASGILIPEIPVNFDSIYDH